jgi:uncharacterized cupredoxin-like copper-binding protein
MAVGARRTRAFAFAIALVLVGGGLAMLAEAGSVRAQGVEVDTSSSLAVTATAPYKFIQPTYQQLPTNTTINVTFTDADTLAHTFSILDREGWVIPATADLDSLFSTYGAVFEVNATGTGTFTGAFVSPGPGWYEFVCLEPGHFESGMYGFIAFGIPLPANLTVSTAATGPGAGVFIISGTIVALVVIALVLGFVVGRRKGSEFEMPPERLGYPEPSPPPEPPAATPMPDDPRKG